MLFYVASAAKSVGEALALFERYFRIANEAVRLKLMLGTKGIIVEVSFIGLSGIQHNTEFGIGVIVKALCEIGRNSDQREFERFYGCPVEFGAPHIS